MKMKTMFSISALIAVFFLQFCFFGTAFAHKIDSDDVSAAKLRQPVVRMAFVRSSAFRGRFALSSLPDNQVIAYVNGKALTVAWSSVRTTNNEHFEVLTSVDGVNWSDSIVRKVGNLTLNNVSSGTHYYIVSDCVNDSCARILNFSVGV